MDVYVPRNRKPGAKHYGFITFRNKADMYQVRSAST